MNAHQLLINELLNETSSSSEDEIYWAVLLITLITNAVSGKRRIKNCKNCQLRINCGSCFWDNRQFRKVFRMKRFIPFEFLNSEDYPSRLCKIKSMAEKYVLAFLWLVILGALENYVVFNTTYMLLDIIHVFTNQSTD
jgi:hypothetical protein